MNIHHQYCSIGSALGIVAGFVYMGTSTAFASVLSADAKYVPIVGIPGVTAGSSLPVYINNVYIIAVGVGALFAVVKIALAGIKYSMSGVVTDKSEAKSDIKGVLLGLAILLLPALVLGTINPRLLNLDVLSKVGKVDLRNMTGTGGTPMNSTPMTTEQISTFIDPNNPNNAPAVVATKQMLPCSNTPPYCANSTSCTAMGGTSWVKGDPSVLNDYDKCYK